jgi:hypothetical protein
VMLGLTASIGAATVACMTGRPRELHS